MDDTKTIGLLYDTAKKQQAKLDVAIKTLEQVSSTTARSTAKAAVEAISDEADQLQTVIHNATIAVETAAKNLNLRSVLFFSVMLGVGLAVLFVVKLTLIPSYSEIQELKAQVQELEAAGGRVKLETINGKLCVRVDKNTMYKSKIKNAVYAVAR